MLGGGGGGGAIGSAGPNASEVRVAEVKDRVRHLYRTYRIDGSVPSGCMVKLRRRCLRTSNIIQRHLWTKVSRISGFS